MEVSNKGGRPCKDASEKKRFVVSTRLDEKEYGRFHEELIMSGLNHSEFVRRAVLSVEVRSRYTPEEFDLYKSLNRNFWGYGNNLNQIARKLKSDSRVKDLYEQLENQLSAMKNLIDIYNNAFKEL